MPLAIHEALSSGGLRYLSVDIEGRVELAEARKLEDWVFPGKPYYHGYVLPRLAKGTDFTPEARKFFADIGNKAAKVAIVTTSAIVRAAVNLIMRYAANQYEIVRMFATEEEALAWLEGSKHAARDP